MILNKKFLDERIGYGKLDESVKYKGRSESYFNSLENYDIFLSHSYQDKEKIFQVIQLFEETGYKVYIDWKEDAQLERSLVTEKTADLLRKRMKISKSLAYFTTSNIKGSKWCPWELGYFDGLKNNRCCILPVLDYESSSFKGQEYLGLYPYLDYAPSESGKYDFWVNNTSGTKHISLSNWLKGVNL